MDGPDTIISGPDSIMDTSDAIISGVETIVSTAEIVFPKGDTIISAFHTSFLAAAISISAAEKTVGAVPAGLFLRIAYLATCPTNGRDSLKLWPQKRHKKTQGNLFVILCPFVAIPSPPNTALNKK